MSRKTIHIRGVKELAVLFKKQADLNANSSHHITIPKTFDTIMKEYEAMKKEIEELKKQLPCS